MDHQKTVSNFDPSSPTAATESPNVNNDDPSKVTSPDYDDRNLIINYVPASMSQEELRLLFSQVGAVDSAKLVRDKVTGQSLCYGFVKFKAPQDAHRAVQFLNGQFVGPKKLKVSIARPSCPQIKDANLYVSGFPKSFSVYDFCDLFTRFGEIITCRILHDNLGRSRGVGFVRMDTHKNAERAILELSGMKFQGLRDRLNVKFANPNGGTATGGAMTNSFNTPYMSIHTSPTNGKSQQENFGRNSADESTCDVISGGNKKRPSTADEKGVQPPNNKQKIAKIPVGSHSSPMCQVPGCVNPNCLYGYSCTPFVPHPASSVEHNPVTTWCQMQQIHFTALSIALQQQAVTGAADNSVPPGANYLKYPSSAAPPNNTNTQMVSEDYRFSTRGTSKNGAWSTHGFGNISGDNGSAGVFANNCGGNSNVATGGRLRAFHNLSAKHRKRAANTNVGGVEREKESTGGSLHFHTISREGGTNRQTTSAGGRSLNSNAKGFNGDKRKGNDVKGERNNEQDRKDQDSKKWTLNSTSSGDSLLEKLFWEETPKELEAEDKTPVTNDVTPEQSKAENEKKETGSRLDSNQLSMVQEVVSIKEDTGCYPKDAKVEVSQLAHLVIDQPSSPANIFIPSPFEAENGSVCGWFDQPQNFLNPATVSPLVTGATVTPLDYPLTSVTMAVGGANVYSMTSAQFSAERLAAFPFSSVAESCAEVTPSPHIIPSVAVSPISQGLPSLSPCVVTPLPDVSPLSALNTTPGSQMGCSPLPPLPDQSPSPVSPFNYPWPSSTTYWPPSSCFSNEAKILALNGLTNNNNSINPGAYFAAAGTSGNGAQLLDASSLPLSLAAAAQSSLLTPHHPHTSLLTNGGPSNLHSGLSDFYVMIRNVPLSAPDSLLASLLSTHATHLKSFNRNNTQCKLLFSSIQDALLSVQLLNGTKFCGNVLEATLASGPCMAISLANAPQNAFAASTPYHHAAMFSAYTTPIPYPV